MAFLGLVPREHTSGDSRHLGGITKAGNAHARWILVEVVQHAFLPPAYRNSAGRCKPGSTSAAGTCSAAAC